MNWRRLLKKSKDIKIKTVFSAFSMLLAVILMPMFYKKYHKLWLICERENEACDNGYHFYKYMTFYHKEQPCIYAIRAAARDYNKVKNIGETVEFGSIKHWLIYFSAKKRISPHATCPDGYIEKFLSRCGLFHPCTVFLQHGITKDKAPYLYNRRNDIAYFITATPQERDFVARILGYGDDATPLLGFSRFDALHNYQVAPRRILIMPTWRTWLLRPSERTKENKEDLLQSAFIREWKNLLKHERFSNVVKKYKLEIYFVMHPNMREILEIRDIFSSPLLTIVDKDIDVQYLLKTSRLLITDYSSVFFDMAYMKKLTIFYQFDEEKFRKWHYPQGWFDYHKTNFGKWACGVDDVSASLEEILKNNFKVSNEFLDEHQRTFPLYDEKNSERIYEFLKKMEK